MKESPIFVKSYETMVWVMQHTGKFPREQRFLMAKRLEDACLDFQALIHRAAKRKEQEKDALAEADVVLGNLRVYNRLSKDLKLLSFKQYEFLAVNLEEIGKLLGGWTKSAMRRSRSGQEAG
jgi:hypothetical protein